MGKITKEKRKEYHKRAYQKNRKKWLRYAKQYRQNNREKVRISLLKGHLQYRYDITLDEYNKLFIQQNGCCVLCGKHQFEMKRRLAVDHNHITGKVRGLLCNKCNNGLGCFNDSAELMFKAINYLEK